MQVELTQQDCQNVKTALLVLAKQAGVGEVEMVAALNLAQKFNWVDLPPQTTKEEKKDEVKQQ
jgi:hypothetical protein